jgi:division protein CdvB (Snf7/Vps24/ESCRT-III family)
MKRSYTEFLQDVLDAITEIGLFVNGVIPLLSLSLDENLKSLQGKSFNFNR